MVSQRVETSPGDEGEAEVDETDFGKAVERPEEQFNEGDLIAGKYRIEKVLGQGGMGIVLRARHVSLDEPVAIKVLRANLVQIAGMVPRFMREARAASKIKSDHVVRV